MWLQALLRWAAPVQVCDIYASSSGNTGNLSAQQCICHGQTLQWYNKWSFESQQNNLRSQLFIQVNINDASSCDNANLC